MGTIRIAMFGLLAAGLTLVAAPASAQTQTLEVRVDGFKNGGVIPNQYRFCVPAEQGHVGPGPDKSPGISWSKGPAGTKSYVITLTDIDNLAEQREKQKGRHDGLIVGSAENGFPLGPDRYSYERHVAARRR